MAKGLKTLGIQEEQALKRRVTRQHALGRISRTDREYLVDLLDKFEARVVEMDEKDDDDDNRREAFY